MTAALLPAAGIGIFSGLTAESLAHGYNPCCSSSYQDAATKARGIVLGVVSDLRSVPERGTLRPGDALMLYTDGLVEVPGRDIDVGIDRLLGEADRLVASGFGAGAAQLVRSMQAGARSSDDCALVLIWRV